MKNVLSLKFKVKKTNAISSAKRKKMKFKIIDFLKFLKNSKPIS